LKWAWRLKRESGSKPKFLCPMTGCVRSDRKISSKIRCRLPASMCLVVSINCLFCLSCVSQPSWLASGVRRGEAQKVMHCWDPCMAPLPGVPTLHSCERRQRCLRDRGALDSPRRPRQDDWLIHVHNCGSWGGRL
jgi:hypothetical protein